MGLTVCMLDGGVIQFLSGSRNDKFEVCAFQNIWSKYGAISYILENTIIIFLGRRLW